MVLSSAQKKGRSERSDHTWGAYQRVSDHLVSHDASKDPAGEEGVE